MAITSCSFSVRVLRAGALDGARLLEESPRVRRARADDGGAVKTMSESQFIWTPELDMNSDDQQLSSEWGPYHHLISKYENLFRSKIYMTRLR